MVLLLCQNCQAGNNRPWKKRVWASLAALAAANAVDVHSSLGLGETNPLLRNAQGSIRLPRSILVKSAATGGLALVELLLLKKAPQAGLEKPFAVVNMVSAGAIAATAARNYTIPPTPALPR